MSITSIVGHSNGGISTSIGMKQIPVIHTEGDYEYRNETMVCNYLVNNFNSDPKGNYDSIMVWMIQNGLNSTGGRIDISNIDKSFRSIRDWGLASAQSINPYMAYYRSDTELGTGLWYGGWDAGYNQSGLYKPKFLLAIHDTITDTVTIVRLAQDTTSIYNDFDFSHITASSRISTLQLLEELPNSVYSTFLLLNYNPRKDPYTFDPDNPDGDGQIAGTGGGEGVFKWKNEYINLPDLPEIDAVDSGFITIFNPSLSQLRALASYMWDGDLFDVATWQKCFANPMDAILGLSIVPVAVPNGGAGIVKVGNMSTGVTMTKAGKQYVTVDCGSLSIEEYWGAYLDYEPYTKAELYLPYCGIHPISVDDIMNKTISVVYHVDILSGACCAYVLVNGGVMYQFIGQCACSIPISGADYTSVINGVLSIAGSIGSMVATGGASAPMALGSIASASVNSLKPEIEKSGAMSGMGGLMGVQVPYLIMSRPNQAIPLNQNQFKGYPSYITIALGDLEGYTEVDSIHLEGIPATDAELQEIENLLKEGVIF